MIKLKNVSKADEQTIKEFVRYVFDYFKISKSVLVVIQFVDPNTLSGQAKKDLLKYCAEMEQNNPYKFTITVSTKMRRMKNKLMCIGHELTHVKQYVAGDMIDWWDGAVNFQGKIYTDWEYGKGYWFSPWELQAYAYEGALYNTFMDK